MQEEKQKERAQGNNVNEKCWNDNADRSTGCNGKRRVENAGEMRRVLNNKNGEDSERI